MADDYFGMELTREEKDVIVAAAKHRGLSISAHVRELALDGSLSWLQALEASDERPTTRRET